jgi:hypothetical protein
MTEETYWRKVDVPSEAITDKVECLIALCRVIGLNYKLTTFEGKYTVEVSWTNEPTDFYEPRKRYGSFIYLGADDLEWGLVVAINGFISQLRRNAEAYRMWEGVYREQCIAYEKEKKDESERDRPL